MKVLLLSCLLPIIVEMAQPSMKIDPNLPKELTPSLRIPCKDDLLDEVCAFKKKMGRCNKPRVFQKCRKTCGICTDSGKSEQKKGFSI